MNVITSALWRPQLRQLQDYIIFGNGWNVKGSWKPNDSRSNLFSKLKKKTFESRRHDGSLMHLKLLFRLFSIIQGYNRHRSTLILKISKISSREGNFLTLKFYFRIRLEKHAKISLFKITFYILQDDKILMVS